MLILTTSEIAAAEITESLGLVRGTTVRTRHWGHHLIAAFKGLVGGEVHEYTKVIAEAREEALDRMKAEAFALGADAVVTSLAQEEVEQGLGRAKVQSLVAAPARVLGPLRRVHLDVKWAAVSLQAESMGSLPRKH